MASVSARAGGSDCLRGRRHRLDLAGDRSVSFLRPSAPSKDRRQASCRTKPLLAGVSSSRQKRASSSAASSVGTSATAHFRPLTSRWVWRRTVLRARLPRAGRFGRDRGAFRGRAVRGGIVRERTSKNAYSPRFSADVIALMRLTAPCGGGPVWPGNNERLSTWRQPPRRAPVPAGRRLRRDVRSGAARPPSGVYSSS